MTATPLPSNSPTLLPTPTGTPDAVIVCIGGCDGNGQVSVDELLTMVEVVLGDQPPSACRAGDGGGDGQVTVDEIVSAVVNALNGCPATPKL